MRDGEKLDFESVPVKVSVILHPVHDYVQGWSRLVPQPDLIVLLW